MLLCPHCGGKIPDEIVKKEGARLMVASRPDRKNPKDKHAATRAKIRYLIEQVQELQSKYKEPNEPVTATTAEPQRRSVKNKRKDPL